MSRRRRQHDRTHPVLRRLDDGAPWRHAFAPKLFNLHDQDDRVSDQDPYKRKHAKNCDESHRRVAEEQCYNHTDECRRSHCEHQEQPAEALQLDHQDRRHGKQHQRRDRSDRSLRLGAFLDGTTVGDAVAGWKTLAERIDFGL
ncbi:hypothetical protein ACVJBD_003931 [Rhizobium mongolense]